MREHGKARRARADKRRIGLGFGWGIKVSATVERAFEAIRLALDEEGGRRQENPAKSLSFVLLARESVTARQAAESPRGLRAAAADAAKIGRRGPMVEQRRIDAMGAADASDTDTPASRTVAEAIET